MSRIMKKHPLLSMANGMVIDLPSPANISYLWNFGSLLGVCLVVQILTGVFLAMHYAAHVSMAFASVEHIMRDVNYGWLLRYLHANGASMFFVCVYVHIARGLYYGSYAKPRILLWTIGVVIFFMMFATAFIGYVLPWGQMSFWGAIQLCLILLSGIYLFNFINLPFIKGKTKAKNRIGPHIEDIYSIIIGSLLGDAYAEVRHGNTRITFYQEKSNQHYAFWLHDKLASLGYCNPNRPKVHIRQNDKGDIRHIIRFSTWTFSSFNWIQEMFYVNGKKIVPKNVGNYLTPLALAIWIQDDGGAVSTGMKIATNCFTEKEVEILCLILKNKYNINATKQSAGYPNQYIIYILTESMPLLAKICKPYVHPSMYYKCNGYMV